MRKSISFAALACVVALATLLGCQGKGEPSLRPDRQKVLIAATTFPASAPIYVAEEKGFFRDEALDAEVLVYDAGILALRDAIAGKVQYATVAETPIARAAIEGEPFRVLMTVAELDRANYIVARGDKGIRSAADLSGRRVGFVPGSTGDFFLHIYLITSRIPAGTIEEVPLQPIESASALISGTVDAVSTWPPFTVQAAEQLGGRAVILDEPGLYTMSWNVVTGAGESTPSRATSERFIKAVGRAEEYMSQNPSEAIEIAARRCKMDAEDLRTQWADIRWGTSLDQKLLLSLEDEARWMIETQQIEGASRLPDFLALIDSRALRSVYPADATIIEERQH